MGLFGDTRKFNGKTYFLHREYRRKSDAQISRVELRRRGYNAIIVASGHGTYDLWKRKK